MVESETFISRRKGQAGRKPPRKLFTAKGMVTRSTIKDTASLEPQRRAETVTVHTRQITARPNVTSSKPQSAQTAPADSPHSRRSHRSSNPNSSEDDITSSTTDISMHIDSDDDLGDVLQMGCMDGLFFSNRGRKGESRIKFNKKGNRTTAVEFKMNLPMPNMNFMDRLAITKSDLELAMNQMHHKVGNPLDRKLNNAMKQMHCKLPYQGIGDKALDALFPARTAVPPFQSLLSLSTSEEEFAPRSPYDPYPSQFDGVHLQAPPSHVFIGEQPCFSEDLIPVDELPPQGTTFDLTRYHPKPLTHRQYAFEKPMLSLDSEDSDPETATAGKNPLSPRDQNKTTAPAKAVNMPQAPMKDKKEAFAFDEIPMISPQVPVREKSDAFAFDEPSDFPSFDEAGPSFDQQENSSTGISSSDVPSIKVIQHVNTDSTHTLGGSNIHISASTTCASSEVSIASDEAIANEKPHAKHISPHNKAPTQKTSQAYYKEKEIVPRRVSPSSSLKVQDSTSTSSSTTTASAPQDENDVPYIPPIRANSSNATDKAENMSRTASTTSKNQKSKSHGIVLPQLSSPPNVTPTKASTSVPSMKLDRETRDLIVRTKFPLSPQNENFYSPKNDTSFTSPSSKNNSKVRHKATKAPAVRSSRFAFDESFDEDEFFETAMA